MRSDLVPLQWTHRHKSFKVCLNLFNIQQLVIKKWNFDIVHWNWISDRTYIWQVLGIIYACSLFFLTHIKTFRFIYWLHYHGSFYSLLVVCCNSGFSVKNWCHVDPLLVLICERSVSKRASLILNSARCLHAGLNVALLTDTTLYQY